MNKKITSLVSAAMSAGMILPLLSTTTVAANLSDGEIFGDPDANRVAYYSFDQQNTNSQWGGEDKNAVADVPVTYEEGLSGMAARLSQETPIRLPYEAFGLTDKGPWTVSYWVKQEGSLNDRCSVLATEDDLFGFDLKLTSEPDSVGGVHVGATDADILSAVYSFTSNEWYHITWTQDPAVGITMYVNGEKADDANAWTIGAENTFHAPVQKIGGVGFDGLVDEVKIYSRVLSEEEIAQDALTDEGGQPQALNMYNELWNENYQLNEKYLTDMEKNADYDHPRHYLGQPDMVRTRTGKLITAYPIGHGVGPLVMRTSTDNGETWVEKEDTPESWKNSQETPTLYTLTLPDGRERIMLITACPTSWGKKQGGWETSYSDDDGETWTPYQSWHATDPSGNKRQAIVAMASLVQLRDPQTGEFIPKWMGVYHDDSNGKFVNYKTYLTFEQQGDKWVEKWSEPTELLPNYHEIETQKGMCEIGMFRSPDGNRIVALARNQNHNGHSTMTYSDDEGETWSQPVDLPGILAGERHKAVYDPVSGRLLITFRRINYDLNKNGVHDGADDWRCGGWEAWVGTYEDLMAQKPGDFTFVLDMDYAPNRYGGDTGYTGITVLEDGTFIMNSYGHFDEEISKNSLNHNIGVYDDICYIRQAKFKLGEIENDFGRIDRAKINEVIQEAEGLLTKEGEYTADSFAAFKNELETARAAESDYASQQVQLDQRAAALEEAMAGLVKSS